MLAMSWQGIILYIGLIITKIEFSCLKQLKYLGDGLWGSLFFIWCSIIQLRIAWQTTDMLDFSLIFYVEFDDMIATRPSN